ncbi:MAG: metallophosphoesterase family protein [Clostridium chrysemydis]|uniref:metallophosphoesterase family protein n=1 Tax=Clostridium chrysemydis TaxID=2665504 RepID=UPI003F392254
MKIAVISDIHGNLYALMKVLEDIEDNKVDTIVCLGDLVGYGPHPNEVVAMIRRRKILCIKGNYDAAVCENEFNFIRENTINSFTLPWTVEELRAENRHYLDNLPTSLNLNFDGNNILFVHGSPNKINEYMLKDSEETETIMKELNYDILVSAHTHLPCAKQFDNKLFINDGSVGKPKIGRPNPTYAILNIDKDSGTSVKIHEVEYEVKRIIKDMKMLNFPERLISSFETGTE